MFLKNTSMSSDKKIRCNSNSMGRGNMVDKLNRINVNIGKVNNDLAKNAEKQPKQEAEKNPVDKPALANSYLDPDKVLDAMKKHGIHNLNHVMASGKVGCKSITEAVDFFTSAISPEMHARLTLKVQEACKKEFPSVNINPDVIAEVVDNLLFDALIA